MKRTFQPGPLGLIATEWDFRIVRDVGKYSPMFHAGVQAGWKILAINEDPYCSIHELKRAASRPYSYSLTFEKKEV